MIRAIPTTRFRRGFFAACLCLTLAACDNPWFEDAPSLDTVLSKGWLFGDKAVEARTAIVQPVYCYETIGDGDCYDEPLEDGGNRLVGFDGPAPDIDPPPTKP